MFCDAGGQFSSQNTLLGSPSQLSANLTVRSTSRDPKQGNSMMAGNSFRRKKGSQSSHTFHAAGTVAKHISELQPAGQEASLLGRRVVGTAGTRAAHARQHLHECVWTPCVASSIHSFAEL